ncbi:MAG: SigB/SigF/SigG family RNA polymerase sigma factor [Christensenellales bacterium]|jgi:RNA polymerase sporulation-specific sigma factor
MNSRLLSHAEALELIAKAQAGDEQAMAKMVEHNVALVKSIAKRFVYGGMEFDDVYQIGCVGLVKAIKNYCADFGVRFSTYAVPMIMGEIKRFARDDGAVKVSRSLKEASARILAARERLSYKLGRDPSIEELSADMDMSPEEIVFALDSLKAPVSLFEKADTDKSLPLMEKLESKESVDIVDRVLLSQIIGMLEAKERQLIVMRYYMDKTQSEIAEKLGISQVQVSRLEKKILLKMRNMAI